MAYILLNNMRDKSLYVCYWVRDCLPELFFIQQMMVFLPHFRLISLLSFSMLFNALRMCGPASRAMWTWLRLFTWLRTALAAIDPSVLHILATCYLHLRFVEVKATVLPACVFARQSNKTINGWMNEKVLWIALLCRLQINLASRHSIIKSEAYIAGAGDWSVLHLLRILWQLPRRAEKVLLLLSS